MTASANGALTRYEGTVARDYLALRINTWQWRREQEVAARLIAGLPRGTKILDAPVGTGRLLPEYIQNSHIAVGVDISEEMLEQASDAAGDSPLISLLQANIESLPLPDEDVDCVVCFRFANWLSLDTLERVIAEFHRVTASTIFLYVRVSDRPGVATLVKRTWKARVVLRFAKVLAKRVWRRSTRSRSATGDGEQIVHREADLLRLFERNGLDVESKVVVEEGEAGIRGIRHPLLVYVLNKA